MHTVELDCAARDDQISAAPVCELVLCCLAGLEGCAERSGIRTDPQGPDIFFLPAGQDDEAARAVLLWKRLGTPPGLLPALGGLNPNLEEPGRLGLEIVFGMSDPGPGAHDLDIAGLGAALVAETVPMRDRALSDIG